MAKPAPQSKVAAERAKLFKLLFASPITGLTPTKLVSWLNAFTRGDLRAAALLWQQIIDRDDQVGPCADKRTRGVSRLRWQVLPVDDLPDELKPEAEKHQKALKHFYTNLSAYDGLNEMERGGVRQLVKQMMTAPGMRYAMHEIIWKPGHPGGLTAEFKFLPLQFFENTTGKLRYLETDHAQVGVDLDTFFGPGNWMCNTGRGLMFASSIAYLFKTPNGLKAWVTWMEKFGTPGVHATTTAQKDTPEWDTLVDAVSSFGEDLAIVTNEGTKIEAIEAKSPGNAPHQALVERMDRAISRIWMGGDLATMSQGSGDGTGSNAQTGDLEILKEDDAESISDALNEYVDTQVIRQRFGDVAPLAYFQLVVPKPRSTDETVKKIETAAKFKVPLSVSFVRQELQLPAPGKDEELIEQPAPAASPFIAGAVNEATLQQRSLEEIVAAKRAAMAPLASRMAEIIGMEDDAEQEAALIKWQADLGTFMRDHAVSEAEVAAWIKALGTGVVSGATEGREKTKPISAK